MIQPMTSSSRPATTTLTEQPRVVALVQLAVVGGLGQQEQQHQADAVIAARPTPTVQRSARDCWRRAPAAWAAALDAGFTGSPRG
jgi:hypothetical protein